MIGLSNIVHLRPYGMVQPQQQVFIDDSQQMDQDSIGQVLAGALNPDEL